MSRRLILLGALLLAGALGCKKSEHEDARTAQDHVRKGDNCLAEGRPAEAVSHFDKSLELEPNYSLAYLRRGMAYNDQKEYAKAVADYEKYAELGPRAQHGHQALAWLYVTAADPAFRDARKAVSHATKACELSKWGDPLELSTLAAAQALAGNFKEAVRRQAEALSLSGASTEAERAEWERRLKLYEAGQPYRRP